jgi:hypothetical protein
VAGARSELHSVGLVGRQSCRPSRRCQQCRPTPYLTSTTVPYGLPVVLFVLNVRVVERRKPARRDPAGFSTRCLVVGGGAEAVASVSDVTAEDHGGGFGRLPCEPLTGPYRAEVDSAKVQAVAVAMNRAASTEGRMALRPALPS